MISTTTALTSSTNPSTYHSTVTFTATVTPGTGGGAAMTGTVTFFNGNVSIGSATVTWNSGPSTGQATLATAALPGGSPSISGAYSGDGNYSNSVSSALTQTVNGLTPTVALTLSVPAPVYGQPVTITADVGSSSWSLLPATGTITFKDGGTTLGTAPLVATLSTSGPVGQAVLTVASFSVGSHSLSASYPGDSNYASATSSSYPMTVSKATSGTNVTASANPSALCQAVTFTASVTAASPGSGTPSGTVTFSVNGTAVSTVSLVSGSATYSSSSLSSGSNTISAQYNGDGNFLTSSGPLIQTVNAAVNWVLTAAAAAPDAVQGVLLPFGTAQVSPLTGNLQRALALDANQHAACGCGGKCGCGGGCGGGCGCANDNCKAGVAPLGLAYNSATTSSNVLPIILATLASDFCAAVPSQIQAQLTWNGTPQGTITYATTGHSAGDVYALPLQVGSAVGSSGIYPWSVEVKATVGTVVYDRTASGTLPVVVNAAGNGCGNGWAVAGTWSLLIGTAGIAIVDNRTGGVRYFTGTGPSYTSPANDQGTLVKNMGGTYTYTSKEQIKTNFNSSGQMTSQVDPHSLTQALAYSAGLLSTITQPDGGVATFTYSGSLLQTVQEPGSRTLTLTYSGNNLTGFIDAAGGVSTFNYDGSNRLVNEQVGPINATYTYATANGTLTQINRGLGTTLSVAAAAAQGLGASTAINASAAAAALTDALSHVTSYTLDALGRPTQVQTADGAVQTWALDAAGNPTVYVDQMGRVTSYTYNASEDLTQVQWADGTRTTYQYDTTFHQVTVIQDALNHRTTNTYDGTTSDLLTVTDALGHVTSYTWSSGLKQTMTDALARVTTLVWNSTKRQQTAGIDALGNVTSYTYDAAGNQTSIEDALGRYTTLTYDGNRKVLTRTNALNGVASYAYDAACNQTSAIDELGRTTSYNYDQRGLQVSVTEAVGTAVQRTTTTNYDAAANMLYVTDALGDITSFAYDVLNRQVATIEAYGTGVQRAVTTAYDQVSNVLSTTDPRALTTSYSYDVRNRETQQIDAYGTSLQRSTNTAYDAVGKVLSVTDPLGNVTSYGYDADNRRTQQIDAYGTSLQRTNTTTYDAVGNVLSRTNPVAAVNSYAYDALNRVTQFIGAYGSAVQRTTTTAYDAVGNVLSVTNPRGIVTSFGYDADNRRVMEVDASGNSLQRTLTTVYDAVGNVLSRTDGLGVVTSYSYDSLNRRTVQLDAYGTALQRAVTTVYDLDNNVTASIDALAYRTTFGYDALNRRVSVQDAGGGVTTTVYDADDNVVNTIDQLGNTTTYSYDALNRRTQTTDARGGIVTLAYDANNNRLSLTDPVNNVTQWLYDALDRKVQEFDPLSNSGTFAYDAADRMTSATDRIGQRIAYSYDLLNRETGETWYNAAGTSVNNLTFTYDANDNLLTAVNNAATNTMAYDALDRTSSVQAPFGAVLTYSYDPADNRTQVQDSFGGTTTRTYDALNRVTTIQFGGSGQTPLREDFTYTARDQVATQTRYSDLAGSSKIGSSTFTYDAVARLTNLQHANGTGSSLANYTNTYDLASRITSETLNGAVPTTYTYDAKDELRNDGQVTYTYDLNGNRTMSGYTIGLANELTSDGTWNYFYDQNGNRIGKKNISTGEWWSYGYDNRNRLVTAQDVMIGVQMQGTYAYDALGKRVEKDVWTGSTVVTRFAYDGSEIWADLSSGNALQTRYIRGDSVLELLARISSGGTAAWILVDRMGSLRNVIDNTGAVIDTITYDGYGNITNETNAANGGQYKYDGYRADAETGWFRPDPTRARYYGPSTGTWISQDPLGFIVGDTNLYRYVGNSPINRVDPSGFAETACCCCCAENLDINKIKQGLVINKEGRSMKVQYNFEVKGEVAYKKISGENGLCKFEWLERTDNATGATDIVVGKWQDHVQLRPNAQFPGDEPMWEQWDKAKKPDPDCTATKVFRVIDRPDLVPGYNVDKKEFIAIKRKLEIRVILTSGCKSCKKSGIIVSALFDWRIDNAGEYSGLSFIGIGDVFERP